MIYFISMRTLDRTALYIRDMKSVDVLINGTNQYHDDNK
jgi:hypothetical protein